MSDLTRVAAERSKWIWPSDEHQMEVLIVEARLLAAVACAQDDATVCVLRPQAWRGTIHAATRWLRDSAESLWWASCRVPWRSR